ncbi:Flagellar motor rotation protein MotA [gamma proteobacterium IMCC2047]|nr:Flagellar motor rotation protein MotA [gamma proteobacterium IMCC2047]
MDVLSVIGIILAFAAVLGGNFIEGGHFSALFNLPAAMIVIGGTLGAAILHSSWASVSRAGKILLWVFNPPSLNVYQTSDKILHWSMTARKEGLLGLEAIVETEEEYFAQKGLRLLVDGTEPEAIRRALEVDLYLIESRDLKAARFFECMGGYAPTIGIIGAVMGLIHVMRNLADPSELGSGIATAFVATIYGVGLANLLFLPIANKLKGVVQQQYQYNEMIVEGVIAIAEGENPRSIEMKLQGYVDHN